MLLRRLEDALLGGVLKLLASLPHGPALEAGRWLGRLAYLLLSSRRRVALGNLSRVYAGRLSASEQRRIARASFESLGLLLVDFARLGRLETERLRELVSIEGVENVLKALDAGRGVLFFTAHFGSWELLPSVAALSGYPMAVIARPADNPLVEARVRALREASGNQVITKWGATREALRLLAKGGLVGMLIDQSVSARRGVAGEFLGRPAHTTDALAQLAYRSGAAVIPAFIVREGRGRRHRLLLGQEIELAHSGDRRRDVAESTWRFVAAVEAVVERWPEQWLWCHRRWRDPS